MTRNGRPAKTAVSDGAWTGFQNHNPATMSGYVLLFRELNSRRPTQSVPLKFLARRRIRLQNLRDGKQQTVDVGADGSLPFQLASAPDFGFYRYQADRN